MAVEVGSGLHCPDPDRWEEGLGRLPNSSTSRGRVEQTQPQGQDFSFLGATLRKVWGPGVAVSG